MEQDFDLFDFAMAQLDAGKEKTENSPDTSSVQLTKAELRQAAMAFLVTLKPDGIAANVPTRRSKYRVAAACFWRPENIRKKYTVAKTALIVMYDDIDCCFSDCADREKRISAITELQSQKENLENQIRVDEPHLCANDDLFGEFPTWDYAASSNRTYKKVCKKLDRELKKLTQGSKLDYIRRAGNADMCYLAVPENFIDPAIVPQEWGIVELTAEPRGFRLLRECIMIPEVSDEGRMQLTLNIASSASHSACFACGVDADGNMRKPPKKRRR